ncbi:MAG TPA: proline dehydrogenase family protein [Candidatus Thermoplasmatota archaeon]|nr:proline dehydrogenase family protein [Candidatus Thermoplasmatota archaeon]
MALSLANTEIAFRSKSDAELRRAAWLFRTFAHPWFVRVGTGALRAALALRLPVEWAVKRTIFRQFVGGETVAECAPVIAELGRFNVGTILDVADEGREGEAESDATMAEVQKTIDLAQVNPAISFCVFKVSGLARVSLLEKLDAGVPLDDAERAEWGRAKARVERLCAHAHSKGVRILIDAEESWIQETIDALATEMMAKFNTDKAIAFNTIQLYRKGRVEFLRESHRRAAAGGYWLGVKLVRGAYMEKERARAVALGVESCILPDKAATDASFDQAVVFSVAHIDRIALVAGTHNEASTLLLADLMEQHGLRRDDPRVCFSQLLGMSDHLSYNLAAEGYNVCKYVPYGPVRSVVPYLTRRAEENTSMRGQVGREQALILQERQRRRTVASATA